MLATRTPLSLTVRRLSDGEFRAFVGMLCMAGESPIRGSLMVSEAQPATVAEVADFAKCKPKDVQSAIEKLAAAETILCKELTVGGTIVVGKAITFMNWADFQPTPKASDSKESRRERKARSRDSHANVTRDIAECHAGEVEVEVEGEVRTDSLRSSARRASGVDPDQPPPHLDAKDHSRIPPLRAVLDRVHAVKGGVPPTVRSIGLVVASFPGRDHVLHAGAFEAWWTAGLGANRPLRDVVQAYRQWVAKEQDSAPGARGATVTPLSSAEYVAAHNAASAMDPSDVDPRYRPAGSGDAA